MARLSRHDVVRPVLAFLPELRPAWWVLRAWLALLALNYLLFGGQSFAFPLPSTLGLGALLSLPLVAVAVVLSVRLGQRAAREPHADPRRRTLTIAGNTLTALLAVVALVAVQERSSQPVYAGDATYYPPPAVGGMSHPDGTPITNIYPYSSAGEPLSEVLLYDQDGRALDNLSTQTHDGQQVSRVVRPGTPPSPANSYPQQQQVLDYDGTPLPPTAPPATAAPTTPTPTAGTNTPDSVPTIAPTAPGDPVPSALKAVPPTS